MWSLNSIKDKFDRTGHDIYKIKTFGLMKLEGLWSHLLEEALNEDFTDNCEDTMVFLVDTLDAKMIQKYPNLKDPHSLWTGIEREYKKLDRSEKALLKKELGNINLANCKELDDYINKETRKARDTSKCRNTIQSGRSDQQLHWWTNQ
jgi:hypothetical protein